MFPSPLTVSSDFVLAYVHDPRDKTTDEVFIYTRLEVLPPPKPIRIQHHRIERRCSSRGVALQWFEIKFLPIFPRWCYLKEVALLNRLIRSGSHAATKCVIRVVERKPSDRWYKPEVFNKQIKVRIV